MAIYVSLILVKRLSDVGKCKDIYSVRGRQRHKKVDKSKGKKEQ